MKNTYFQAMFGPGYDAVIAYLETLSGLSDTDCFNGHGPRLQPEKQGQFRQIGATAAAFLVEMDSQRSGEAGYQENWDFLKFHGRYCILLSAALASLCTGDRVKADNQFRAFCGYIRENALKVQSRLDVYRVIEAATQYTGFSKPE